LPKRTIASWWRESVIKSTHYHSTTVVK
jgi:hypothetical protein